MSSFLQRFWIDWQFKTTPQQHTYDRVHNWPRGKVLGGSSSINALLFVRCNQRDYDRWEEVHGCDGWSWKDVLPYFKRLEDNPHAKEEPELHGLGGPVTVTRATPEEGTKAFIQASQKAGLKYGDNMNGREQEGVFVSESFVKEGRRQGSAQTHLKLALENNKGNFFLRTHAQVTRVVVDDKKQVKGVKVVDTRSPEVRNLSTCSSSLSSLLSMVIIRENSP